MMNIDDCSNKAFKLLLTIAVRNPLKIQAFANHSIIRDKKYIPRKTYKYQASVGMRGVCKM